MRFIFKVLLGFVIFNAMLIILASYFPELTSSVNAKDVTNDLSAYSNIGQLIGNILTVSGGTFLAAIAIGAGLSRTVNNFPTGSYIGASFIISIILGLWSAVTTPLISLTKSYTILDQWYNLFTICFGIVAIISISEIFTGKGDEA